jgi:hypothetical protein
MGIARHIALAALVLGCQSNVGQAAVSLGVKIDRQTPGDASVFIDEEYIGPLGYVAAHGVRLPVGEHRISVKREGYFPWDRLVVADRQPIRLDVKLDRIPD